MKEDTLNDLCGQGDEYARDGDFARAVECWRQAAEQGHADAQCKLGGAYALGQGVTKDKAQAVEWWRKAGEQGHADAQFKLGGAYKSGHGVLKNETKATEWYRKAAIQGHTEARKRLDALENKIESRSKTVEHQKPTAGGFGFAGDSGFAKALEQEVNSINHEKQSGGILGVLGGAASLVKKGYGKYKEAVAQSKERMQNWPDERLARMLRQNTASLSGIAAMQIQKEREYCSSDIAHMVRG